MSRAILAFHKNDIAKLITDRSVVKSAYAYVFPPQLAKFLRIVRLERENRAARILPLDFLGVGVGNEWKALLLLSNVIVAVNTF